MLPLQHLASFAWYALLPLAEAPQETTVGCEVALVSSLAWKRAKQSVLLLMRLLFQGLLRRPLNVCGTA